MAAVFAGGEVSHRLFDALLLKIRDEGTVKNKAVYLALGIRADEGRPVCAENRVLS